MGSKSRQTDTLYPKKTVQRTVYITREADQKLRAAMKRGARRGRRISAANVMTYCVLASADNFDRETAEAIATLETP